MIMQIKSKATSDGKSVYPKASLPMPAAHSPIGAPGQPTGLKVVLHTQGEIELKWKCPNPKGSEGTMYEIQRKIGDGPNVPLGTVGKKRFVDETLPRGTAYAMYSIRAIRSTRRGAVATFNVFLGVGKGHIPQNWRERTARDKNGSQLAVRAA
jgi:hypothetical protein